LSDWKADAIKLKEQGLSSRTIGKMLGKGKSTINDLISKLRVPEVQISTGKYLHSTTSAKLYLDVV